MGAATKLVRRAIQIANSILNLAIGILFLLMIAYGCYALWDSNHVVTGAMAEQYAVYKPSENPLSFRQLQGMNSDVFGWITIYGTPIDYPLLQAEDNWKYVNTSAEGEYSLTGAIFLDSAADKSFNDFNSIIYGHNMVPNVMFGDIKTFKEKEYFDSHKYGNLYYDGRDHGLEIFAVVEADAYDAKIYTPGIVGDEARTEYLDYLLENAEQVRDVAVTVDDRIVLLSTCSTESTNGREILVGRITDEIYENEYEVEQKEKKIIGVGVPDEVRIWERIPLRWQLLIAAVLLLIFAATGYRICRRRHHKEQDER
jgi:sortase B